MTSQLSLIEINPQSPPKRSIIWMHGLGADANDFVPIVKELRLPDSLGLRFVFPNAPVMPITINNGYEMRAWYDIAEPDLHGNVDYAGIQQSAEAIRQLIQQEIDRGLASTDIMLAGFSQGAAMTLTVGLCYPQTLGGMIALSGYLPLMDKVMQQATEANRQTPIFIGHGTDDFLVPYHSSQLAYQALQKANYPVSIHSYPMQHSVCLEEVRDISQWLQEIW